MADDETTTETTETTWGLVREDPAPAPRSAAGGALYATLEKLATAEDVGQWYRLVTCKSRSGANSIVTSIRAGRRKIPAGQFEFTCRTNGKENSSVLYARYMGPGETTFEETPATETAKKAPAAAKKAKKAAPASIDAALDNAE